MFSIKVIDVNNKKIEAKYPKLDFLIEKSKISNIRIIDPMNNIHQTINTSIKCSGSPEHNMYCWIEIISLGINKCIELNYNSLIFPVPFSIYLNPAKIIIEIESWIDSFGFKNKDEFYLIIKLPFDYSSPHYIQQAYRSVESNHLLNFQMPQIYSRKILKEKVESMIRERDYWDDKNTIVTPSALSRLDYEDRKPILNTIASIALGCHLNINEANQLFGMFGYCLSQYYEYDQIVSHFLKMNIGKDRHENEEKYSINDVNEMLLKITKAKYNRNNPLSKYKYANRLVGTPDDYRVTLLKVAKKEKGLTEDQFNYYKNKWDLDDEDFQE